MILIAMDHPVWAAIQQHLLRNTEAYLGAVTALFIAAACVLPKKRPRTLDDFYDFFRDTVQTAVPAARARHEESSSTVTKTPTTQSVKEASTSTALDPAPVVEPPKEGV